MLALVGGGAAVVVAAIAIGLIFAFSSHGSTDAKPTAQSKGVNTTQPANAPGSPSAVVSASSPVQDQSQVCGQVMGPLASQMENVANELSSDPSNVTGLASQLANLYSEAAQNASSDPQLQTDLRNIANDLNNLSSDLTNQNSTGVSSDGTKLQNDLEAANQLCDS
jgi:hypothetical protein